MSLVNLERDGALSVITIDNPPQNRITEQMSSEFLAVLDTIEADEVRALLLTTKGPDFCFGGDIMPWPEMSNRQLRAVLERHMTVFNRFERLPIPVVAAVQGLCFGGGLELAIRADIIIAGETSRFGHPEQSLGIIHGARRRLPRRRACGPRLRLPVADDLRAGAGRDHASAGRGQSGRARRGLAVDGPQPGRPAGAGSNARLRRAQGAVADLGGVGSRRCR